MDNRVQAIFNELRNHPEGLSFNQLCDRLKDRMARQTVSVRLSQLVEQKLVQKTPEKPRKGQRVLYKSTEALKEIESRLEVISYVALQQKQAIEKSIDDWENGKVSDKTFFNKLIDHIISIPQKVMGIAYVLAYGYDEAIAEYILLVAFRWCNETESHIKSLLDNRAVTKKRTFRKAVLEFLEQQGELRG
jgi:DNA-binding HxlR family transcriptional regulator